MCYVRLVEKSLRYEKDWWELKKKGGRGLLAVCSVLEAACACDDVLLVYGCGDELEAIPPLYVLDVVGVHPDCVEYVVGSDSDVCVVADEAAAKVVSCVDRLGCYDVRCGCGQVSDDVVESCVVYVAVKCCAVDSSFRGWRATCTYLPRRDDVGRICGHVDAS